MTDLDNEILAVRAIYGEEVLTTTNEADFFILSVPSHPLALQLRFPKDYPSSCPLIEGTESTGSNVPKGYGNHVMNLARQSLSRIWSPGEVCLFDLIQELESILAAESLDESIEPDEVHSLEDSQSIPDYSEIHDRETSPDPDIPPPAWTISAPTTVKKSLFIARACPVSSPAQVKYYISNLIATDKKIAKATHNITAYRIRQLPDPKSDTEPVQSKAAGGRLLHLMQVMDVWGVLVVVSRWYGGVKLGPDRFRIIGDVAREVLVQGGWVEGRKKDGKGK